MSDRPKFYYDATGNPHNYPPNAVVWPIGSYVLHDFDAKEDDRMLLRVISLPDEESRVEVQYVDPQLRHQFRRSGVLKKTGGRHLCHLTYLHDPAQFGVTT